MARATIDPPSSEIMMAFGAAPALPVALDGGQGVTFRIGELVMKRCDDIRQTEWLSGVMENVKEEGFRIARPVRAQNGEFVVDGWCASPWIDGSTALDGQWHEAIAACQAFHQALKRIPWSPALSQPGNPYGRADAVVWDGDWPAGLDLGPVAGRLRRLYAPVTLPAQLVQGDPSEGNILFTPGKPPAIIDIAPYWHPADYAIAMFIADGIAWSGAPVSLLDTVAGWPEMGQLLLRAVLFRLYVGYLFRGGPSASEHRARAYAPVIQTIDDWCR